MNIMELGAIGELVGGVAVIASLVFVGMQIRRGNEQVQRGNAMERARTNREVSREIGEIFKAMSDPESVEIYRRSLVDFDALTSAEQAIMHSRFLIPMTTHVLSTYLAARDDLLDEEMAERWTNYFVMVVKSPGIGKWWDLVKADVHTEFAEVVDRLRRDPDGPPPYHVKFPWFAPDPAAAEA